jgi:hypothetical protein
MQQEWREKDTERERESHKTHKRQKHLEAFSDKVITLCTESTHIALAFPSRMRLASFSFFLSRYFYFPLLLYSTLDVGPVSVCVCVCVWRKDGYKVVFFSFFPSACDIVFFFSLLFSFFFLLPTVFFSHSLSLLSTF